MAENKRRVRTRSIINNTSKEKERETENLNFKETEDLMEEYKNLIKSIMDNDLQNVLHLIRSSDMKYFLVHNDLDYNLFKYCVKFKRQTFIR
jgi:hypothetical protein